MDTRRIQIDAHGLTVVASLNDSDTATALWKQLPITSRVQTWGDEIYFSIPIEAAEAPDAAPTVEKGAVAYWPPGSALCLFWGPTPMSQGDEIRPASAVNVVGQIEGNPEVLGDVPSGVEIIVSQASGS